MMVRRTSDRQRRSAPIAAVAGAALCALALGAGTATAAGPGETIVTGGLEMPAGAFPGATSGAAYDDPQPASISADGRYVAFISDMDLLAPDAAPDVTNVYRKDRLTGAVVLVSRADGPNGAGATKPGYHPRISADGMRVAWGTRAALDPADGDGDRGDVYVRDLTTGTTVLASQGNGGLQTSDGSSDFAFSANGRYVAFSTTNPLAGANDTNAKSDVYVRDLNAPAATTLVSRKNGAASAANGDSYAPAISGDGRWVAFISNASDAIAGYTGSGYQVFARDTALSQPYLVSNKSANTSQGGNGGSSTPVIAGTPAAAATVSVAYTSDATDVAAGGVDAASDASVYLRSLGSTSSQLVSRATGPVGASADSRAHDPSISDDGKRIAFASDATNLGAGAGDGYYGVYLRDLRPGPGSATTTLASANNRYAVYGALAGDGSLVTWFDGQGTTPDSDPLLPGVFARTIDPSAATYGAPELVARPPGSAPVRMPAVVAGTIEPGTRAVSADGRYVVFAGESDRLPGWDGSSSHVYRRDLTSGAIELVSRADGPGGAPAGGYSEEPSISADGTRVVFRSSTKLTPDDTNDKSDVYVRDLAAGTTRLVSRADGPAGAVSDDGGRDPRISADGTHVAFAAAADNLGAPGGDPHIYVRDLAAGTTRLADRADGADGALSTAGYHPSLSGDGRLLAFSTLTALDPADTGLDYDVYVRDVVAGTTRLVSRRSGLAGAEGVGYSNNPVISADGRIVAFDTQDEELATDAGAWGGKQQVVARDLTTGANTLVSRAPGGGAPASDDAGHPSIDADGSEIAFRSSATNLLPGRGGVDRDAVFVRSIGTGALSGPPAFGIVDNDPSNGTDDPSISDDGQCVAFNAYGHAGFNGPVGDIGTSYLYVVSGNCPKPLAQPSGPPVQGKPAPRPTLTKASLLRKRFRVSAKRTATVAQAGPVAVAAKAKPKPKRKPRPTPVGTAFRFRLNTTATVTFKLERRTTGRRVGKTCRKATAKLRRKPACVRWVAAGTLTRGNLKVGTRSVAFSGRVGKRALPAGSYRARLVARNTTGASKTVTLTFAVVRR